MSRARRALPNCSSLREQRGTTGTANPIPGSSGACFHCCRAARHLKSGAQAYARSVQRASTKRDDRRRRRRSGDRSLGDSYAWRRSMLQLPVRDVTRPQSVLCAQTAHPLLTPAQSSRWPSRGLDVVSTAGVGRTLIVFVAMYGETLSPGGELREPRWSASPGPCPISPARAAVSRAESSQIRPDRGRPHCHQRRDAHPGVVGVALPAAFCRAPPPSPARSAYRRCRWRGIATGTAIYGPFDSGDIGYPARDLGLRSHE